LLGVYSKVQVFDLRESCPILNASPPIVSVHVNIWATTSWEAELALVKLQESGLEVHLPVKVCCYYTLHACAHSAGKYLVLSI